MNLRPLALLITTGAFAQSAGDVSYWLNLRKSLLKEDTYFDQLRDSGLPAMEGTIVTMEPALRPHTLMIGIETPLVAELRLEIQRDGQDSRLNTTPARKSKIRFHMALPKSVRKQPFILTATVEEMNLDYEEDPAPILNKVASTNGTSLVLEFTNWIEMTWLSIWLREAPTLLAFPTVLIFHTIGLGFLAGPAIALDLRLLGFAPNVPLDAMRKFVPVGWLGFLMNATSGLLLLWAYPTKNLTNPIFYLKLTLIGTGMWLWVKLSKVDAIDGRIRNLAKTSIFIWAAAVTAGRLLAYTYKHLMASE